MRYDDNTGRPARTKLAAATLGFLVASAGLPFGAALAQQPQQKQAEDAGAPKPAGVQTDLQAGQMWASGMVGSDVHGPNNQRIGDVYDLVVDPRSGQVVSVVLAVGGFLGVGEKRVAVPIKELKLENDRLVTDMTKELLQSAPSFAARSTGMNKR